MLRPRARRRSGIAACGAAWGSARENGREILTGGGAGEGRGGGSGGMEGATGSMGARRGGMVGTRSCGGVADTLSRGVLRVATRTGVGLEVDRFATPGMDPSLPGWIARRGVRKRLCQTSRRGRGAGCRSHSARAPLTLRGPRRTIVRMTVACGGEVVRRERGSRWASGLIPGGETAPATIARSTCEGVNPKP